MGRLSTLTVILVISAWGAATEGASPDDANSPSASAARKPAPVPPIRYLEAGSRLFNSGNFELAAKYLDAAQMYRDQLQQDEQTTLDAYVKELAKVRAATAGPAPATGGAAPAKVGTPAQAAPPVARVIQSGDPARGGAGDVAVTPDVKQHAVWLLHEAREQIARSNFEAAEKKIAEAEAIDVKWGLFDDTPTKVRNDLNKERPKTSSPGTGNVARSVPHNRENAQALLHQARAALANHQIEQAEAIAQEVKTWNLSYSFFGESPDKVAAAARALRKRDKIRNTPPREQPSQGVYDVLVQESRQLMKLGKLNEAEAKALQAERMNVVPGLTADRAETVLHDIAMARVQSAPSSPAATPAALAASTTAEPPSAVAEREANALLDKGDQARAAAKFAESEKLRMKESSQAAAGPAIAAVPPPVARRRRLQQLTPPSRRAPGPSRARNRCLPHPARTARQRLRKPAADLPGDSAQAGTTRPGRCTCGTGAPRFTQNQSAQPAQRPTPMRRPPSPPRPMRR